MKLELKTVIFYIITVLILFITFFAFQPKILSLVLGFRQQELLNSFIDDTKKNGKVDVQEFWKLREFYCPASFSFARGGSPFATYSCRWLLSKDYLVTTDVLNTPAEATNIIAKRNNYLIYKKNNDLIITFIASNAQMKQAVGFFDYRGTDKDFTKDKSWFDYTVIHQ